VVFAKLVGVNLEIKMPFKRYEIGKVRRDGPVKLGREHEFIQCDVDMVKDSLEIYNTIEEVRFVCFDDYNYELYLELYNNEIEG